MALGFGGLPALPVAAQIRGDALEILPHANNASACPTGAVNMPDPLRSIDRWASQSGDRATLLLWLVVIAMVAFVAFAVGGLIWYTAPGPPAH